MLTSSVTRSGQRTSESLQLVRLEDILIPTLVVHHDNDRRAVTPYGEAKALLDRLQRAPQKEFRSFSGGSTPLGDPCEPFSPHGFYGIDDEVVRAKSDWIKKINSER